MEDKYELVGRKQEVESKMVNLDMISQPTKSIFV